MASSQGFVLGDIFQQVVGGFILAGPFIATEEVWLIGMKIGLAEAIIANLVAFAIGFGALYIADKKRDIGDEEDLAGVPSRFISLIVVSYSSVVFLSLILSAPTLFIGGVSAAPLVFFKTISAVAIFSVVGAATADSVL